MEFPYETDLEGETRPLVGARFYRNGLSIPNPPAIIPCLVDTGSVRTFLQWELGTAYGVWPETQAYGRSVQIGGMSRQARETIMSVEIPDPQGGQSIVLERVQVLFVKGKLPVPGLLGASVLNGLVAVFRDREGFLNIREAGDFARDECPHYNGAYPL